MEQIDLLKILEGDISRIDSVNVSDIALYEVRVTVEPRHIRTMLNDYLDCKVNAKDITRWASFICLRAEYGTPNYLDDEIADYYEDMFYVIQRLSTPEIDGEVNEERVRQYLSELDKYPPDTEGNNE
tara:strand:- start:1424 stop:1804 length:381 start_codon:yes stop_codon:yes gene_type:complete